MVTMTIPSTRHSLCHRLHLQHFHRFRPSLQAVQALASDNAEECSASQAAGGAVSASAPYRAVCGAGIVGNTQISAGDAIEHLAQPTPSSLLPVLLHVRHPAPVGHCPSDHLAVRSDLSQAGDHDAGGDDVHDGLCRFPMAPANPLLPPPPRSPTSPPSTTTRGVRPSSFRYPSSSPVARSRASRRMSGGLSPVSEEELLLTGACDGAVAFLHLRGRLWSKSAATWASTSSPCNVNAEDALTQCSSYL